MKRKQHVFSTFIFCCLVFGLGFTVPNYAANIIVVEGEIKSFDAAITAQDLQIIITHKEHKISQQGLIDGQEYTATFLDFTRSIAEVGDTFEVMAKVQSGEIVGKASRKLTDGDIRGGVATINISIWDRATIYVNPPEIKSPKVGETLIVDVNVMGGKNVSGFQFTLTYDETALEFVEVKLGDYLPAGAFAVPAEVDAGIILYGATAIGVTAAKADGTLAILTFNVVAEKDSAVGFSSASLSDAIAKQVASISKGAVISAGDGIETGNNNDLVKEKIPLPDVATIYVGPSSIVSPVVGEFLSIDINISGGENVASFQFTLTYDETALEFVEVKLGDYLPPGAFAVPVRADAGSILYGATAIGAKADKSSGTLAAVTFKVLEAKASHIGCRWL